MPTSWRSKWSLQTRILVLILVISASVLTVMEWLSTLSAVRAIENSVGTRGVNAARQLAQDLETLSAISLRPEFENRAREILELEPDVVRVDVYADVEGKLKLLESSSSFGDRAPEKPEVDTFRNGNPGTFALVADSTSKIYSTHPFQFRDGRKGFVTVVSSLRSINDILAVRLRIRILSVLATTVLLVTAIALLFRSTIYRNVHHLVEVMDRFKNGQATARAKEELPGEFGDLARNLNLMLEAIQGFNNELKQQIRAATDELSSRNHTLQELNLSLHETQKRLNQAERLALVGQLTATFAHEVGSPLSAISTNLQLLLEEPHPDPQGLSSRLRLANDQIDRVCSIVEGLLTTTRLKARMLPVELEEIIRRVADLLGPSMESSQVAFELRGLGRPFETQGDPDQLQQLFLNLFNNSLDAISGRGTLAVEIRRLPPDRNHDQRYFQIDVLDSGAGIPPDRLEHIFEPFFTTKSFGKGTGLGLVVSKEIVKQHGGRISVVSSLGKGTCFTILLPEIQTIGVSPQAKIAVKEAKA